VFFERRRAAFLNNVQNSESVRSRPACSTCMLRSVIGANRGPPISLRSLSGKPRHTLYCNLPLPRYPLYSRLPRVQLQLGARRTRSETPVLACGPKQEVGTARNRPTANHDLQPATTYTGHRANRATKPTFAGMAHDGSSCLSALLRGIV
jgi:hypothetical protein